MKVGMRWYLRYIQPKPIYDSIILNLYPSRSLFAHCITGNGSCLYPHLSSSPLIFLCLFPPCPTLRLALSAWLPAEANSSHYSKKSHEQKKSSTNKSQQQKSSTAFLCWWGIKVTLCAAFYKGLCWGNLCFQRAPAPSSPPALLPSPNVVPLNTTSFSPESSGRPDLSKLSSVIKWVFNNLVINLAIQ